MTKFPLIDSLKLKVWNDAAWADDRGAGFNADMVRASDLERVLGAGVRVYGGQSAEHEDWYWAGKNESIDTHTALLIAISPIRKGVKRSEIEALVDRGNHSWKEADDILKRILDHGLEDK